MKRGPIKSKSKVSKEKKPRIVSDPEVLSGAPCIEGTRIPAHVVSGFGVDGSRKVYPFLSEDQIHCAIAFAAQSPFWMPRRGAKSFLAKLVKRKKPTKEARKVKSR